MVLVTWHTCSLLKTEHIQETRFVIDYSPIHALRLYCQLKETEMLEVVHHCRAESAALGSGARSR